MKSPFPGMDPYLEGRWRDVHQSLVTYIRDAIQPGLPEALVARTEERVFVDSGVDADADRLREFYPDVRVINDGWLGAAEPNVPTERGIGGTIAAEPLLLDVDSEPMTEGFVQVLEDKTGQVITVIEVLSPTNKRAGDGANQYVKKRVELERSGVGLVEIDLLRAGRRVQRVPEQRVPAEARTPYRACAQAGWLKGKAFYYDIPLRAPLPTIRVPLRKGDPEVALDLQAILDQAYRNGRYYRTDYTVDADPPLVGDDAKWADELLRASSRR